MLMGMISREGEIDDVEENCKKGSLWKARTIGPKFVNNQLKQFYTQADSEQDQSGHHMLKYHG